MGLVMRILGRPTLYKAMPLEEGILTLLERKKKQYYKVHNKAEKLLRSTSVKGLSQKIAVEEFKIRSYTRKSELSMYAQTAKNGKNSIDLMLNNRVFVDGVINMPEPHIKSLKQGVKYRVITQKIDLKPIWNSLQKLMAHSNFQLRFTPDLPPVLFAIKDEKVVGVALSAEGGIGEGQHLEFQHSGLREVFQIYFDNLWNQAYKYKPITTP